MSRITASPNNTSAIYDGREEISQSNNCRWEAIIPWRSVVRYLTFDIGDETPIQIK